MRCVEAVRNRLSQKGTERQCRNAGGHLVAFFDVMSDRKIIQLWLSVRVRVGVMETVRGVMRRFLGAMCMSIKSASVLHPGKLWIFERP